MYLVAVWLVLTSLMVSLFVEATLVVAVLLLLLVLLHNALVFSLHSSATYFSNAALGGLRHPAIFLGAFRAIALLPTEVSPR